MFCDLDNASGKFIQRFLQLWYDSFNLVYSYTASASATRSPRGK